ncbi:hypothetical protein OSCT_0903 [Oscillochloris trichoides DG-6]|uniref:Glycosyltransferase RgtA/B/C/D-like domain-containing protein n=1 Tax=Oscillochloris trichoides DG-6 TaxID=765420 RepID=E1IC52_9CHLR|nr:hypothetical protein OSCT_0903 [Oscillochloris trichoides DG-6]
MTATTLTARRRALLAVLLCAGVLGLMGPLGRMVLMFPLLLLAPGYLIERRSASRDLPLLPRLTLWIGLSLSLWPLLYLWLTTFGLRLNDPLLWLLAILLALGSMAAAWHDLGSPPPNLPPLGGGIRLPPPAGAGWGGGNIVLALALLLLTLWVRLEQIKDLALPAWVDSVHHALMIRVAAEQGAAPFSLRPYLPVDDLPYHWGYHVLMATLMRLSGLDLVTLLLLPGQILNTLAGVVVAGLAHYLWRRPVAALGALLVVGLLAIMPAYYVSWGRYTQLSGLLLLPGLAIAWAEALRGGQRSHWALVSLQLAGLSLVHFRVLIFALALLAVQASLFFWQRGRLARVGMMLLSSLTALLLTTPWLWLLARRTLMPALASNGLAGGGSYNDFSSGLLWSGQNEWLVGMALLAALIGLGQRQQPALIMLLWAGVLLILSNPWLLTYLAPAAGLVLLLWAIRGRNWPAGIIALGLLLLNPWLVALPYLWLITNDVVIISLFVPLAVLIGGGAALCWDEIAPRLRWPRILRLSASALPQPQSLPLRSVRPLWQPRILRLSASALLLGLGLWGGLAQRSVINQVTILATPADYAALTWVASHTPSDAFFLINHSGWLPGSQRGVDGGWWLLPLTGRQTTTPPVLYIYGDPAYVARVQALEQQLASYTPGNEQALFDLIVREKITYLYFGPNAGTLKPEIFVGHPGFEVVYQVDGVTIIAVTLPAPAPDPPTDRQGALAPPRGAADWPGWCCAAPQSKRDARSGSRLHPG